MTRLEIKAVTSYLLVCKRSTKFSCFRGRHTINFAKLLHLRSPTLRYSVFYSGQVIMKLILSNAVLFFFFSSGALAQTPGVAIAPAFEIVDGKPNEIGAYYRKVITPASVATLGIHSRGGTVPEFAEDANRYFIQDSDGAVGYSLAEMNDPKTGSKDRPSIYMGGRSNNVEVDAGLAWNRVFAVVPGATQARATWTTEADASSRIDQYVIGVRDGSYVVKDLAGTEVAVGASFQPGANGTVIIGTKTLRPNFAFRPFFRSSDRTTNAGYHTISTLR